MKGKAVSKIKDYNVEQMAKDTKFTIRPAKKIGGEDFIRGFFNMMDEGEYTVKNWAAEIALKSKDLVSKQGVLKKLSYRHLEFAENFLCEVTTRESSMVGGVEETLKGTLFCPFTKVFLEDSTCISLPRNLSDTFRSSYSKTKEAATAKVQLRMDLKTGRFHKIDVGDFRDSDGAYAPDILESLGEGDLVIRDLGYWKTTIFEKIGDLGAYYLSLYKRNVGVYNQNDNRLDLYKILKKADRMGKTVYDISARMGSKEKLNTRLVAKKLPKEMAEKRREAALKDRDKRKKTDANKLFLLGWEIYVTNVPKEIWTPEQVSKAYGFRWRIEMIFKCWKSYLSITTIFDKTEMSYPHALIALLLALSWITMSFFDEYLYYSRAVYKKKGIFISLHQFAQFYIKRLDKMRHLEEDVIIDFIAYYCQYDKRKDRINHMEKYIRPC